MAHLDNLDYVSIGRRVYARRQALGMTQGELAKAVGVSNSFIGHIERAEKNASLETVVHLCDALNLTLDALVLGIQTRCEGEKCPLYGDLRRLFAAYDFDLPNRTE